MINPVNTQVVLRENARLYQELCSMAPEVTIDSVVTISGGIDELVVMTLLESITRNLSSIYNSTQTSLAGKLLVVDGVECSLQHSYVDITTPRSISIIMEPVLARAVPCVIIDVPIDVSDRFTQVRYKMPSHKAPNDQLLVQLTRSLFRIGYRWIMERLNAAVRQAANEAQRRLYEFVRVMIEDERMLEGMLFCAMAKAEDGRNLDFVLLDERAVATCLELARSVAPTAGRSSADLVAKMMTEIVEFEDSAMSEVKGASEPVVVNLRDKYTNDPDLNIAIRAVWGDEIACYQICAEEDFMLFVFFSPQHIYPLAEFFQQYQGHLADLARDQPIEIIKSLGRMERIKKALTRAVADPDIGAFAGAFTGSLIREANRSY